MFKIKRFNKIHKESPCNLCGNDVLDINKTTKMMSNNRTQTTYSENCAMCGNLLYGWVD